MGISMSDDEAWDFIEKGHTGVFATLRRDGWPVALPLWFAVHGRRIYLGTPSQSMKLRRIAHDDRGSFLVETGEKWAELAAVHLPVRATVLDAEADAEEMEQAGRLFAEKYAASRTSTKSMPKATSKHYSSQRIIRLDPAGPALSWDNSRIRLAGD